MLRWNSFRRIFLVKVFVIFGKYFLLLYFWYACLFLCRKYRGISLQQTLSNRLHNRVLSHMSYCHQRTLSRKVGRLFNDSNSIRSWNLVNLDQCIMFIHFWRNVFRAYLPSAKICARKYMINVQIRSDLAPSHRHTRNIQFDFSKTLSYLVPEIMFTRVHTKSTVTGVFIRDVRWAIRNEHDVVRKSNAHKTSQRIKHSPHDARRPALLLRHFPFIVFKPKQTFKVA